MPVLVGIAGLGTEGGLWLYTQQAVQGAANSGGDERGMGLSTRLQIFSRRRKRSLPAMASSYGTNGVTCNREPPPKSGNYTAANGYTCSTYPCAIEVTVTKSLNPLFSSLWFSKPFNISATSVVMAPQLTQGILALGKNNPSGAVAVAFLAAINLTGCGVFSDSNSSSSIEVAIFGGN